MALACRSKQFQKVIGSEEIEVEEGPVWPTCCYIARFGTPSGPTGEALVDEVVLDFRGIKASRMHLNDKG